MQTRETLGTDGADGSLGIASSFRIVQDRKHTAR